jgi:hypothetical protein
MAERLVAGEPARADYRELLSSVQARLSALDEPGQS